MPHETLPLPILPLEFDNQSKLAYWPPNLNSYHSNLAIVLGHEKQFVSQYEHMTSIYEAAHIARCKSELQLFNQQFPSTVVYSMLQSMYVRETNVMQRKFPLRHRINILLHILDHFSIANIEKWIRGPIIHKEWSEAFDLFAKWKQTLQPTALQNTDALLVQNLSWIVVKHDTLAKVMSFDGTYLCTFYVFVSQKTGFRQVTRFVPITCSCLQANVNVYYLDSKKSYDNSGLQCYYRLCCKKGRAKESTRITDRSMQRKQ